MFELVELKTMTVSPKRTMLPPIWVAACDSQRRRNPPLLEDGERTGGGWSGGGRRRRSSRRSGRRSSARSRRSSPASPRLTNSTSRRSRVRPLEQHVPAAALAAQPDVGAEAIDQPGAAATGVRAAEADDVTEEQREDGLVWHRRVRVSKAGSTVRRDERPGGRRQLEPIDRGDRDGDLGLGRGQLGDDPAGPGQRAGQLVRRADRVDVEAVRERGRRRPGAAPAAPVTTTPVTTRMSPMAMASAPALRSSLNSSSTPAPSIGPWIVIVTPGPVTGSSPA